VATHERDESTERAHRGAFEQDEAELPADVPEEFIRSILATRRT
jgi:hypothetical protein